jgi:hypothetical protein
MATLKSAILVGTTALTVVVGDLVVDNISADKALSEATQVSIVDATTPYKFNPQKYIPAGDSILVLVKNLTRDTTYLVAGLKHNKTSLLSIKPQLVEADEPPYIPADTTDTGKVVEDIKEIYGEIVP